MTNPALRCLLLPLALVAGLVATLLMVANPASAAPVRSATAGQQWNCAYTAHSISELNDFSKLVGAPVNCGTVFNDASPDWTGWVDPWFEHHPDPNLNWAKWKTAVPGRRLAITQNLFPASLNNSDWLTAGARGDYTGYAVQLAKNLVSYGLGDSILRIAHEANGTWYPYSVPSDAAGQTKWRQFWAVTVRAMKSVAGANFTFVWCVNYGVRDMPLQSFYPGDDVVDVVGLDAYDSIYNGPSADRYSFLRTRSLGINEVARFARQHGKKFALPEWGLENPGTPYWGGGDDPDYVSGIRTMLRNRDDIAFQSYWYAHQDTMTLLQTAQKSLPIVQSIFQRT